MLKRINDVLPELILEIFIYGLIVQVAGVWFAEDKRYYSIGLWIGIAVAMGMAVHMATIIRDTVDRAAAEKSYIRTGIFSVLRYVVVVVLFVVVLYFDLGNVIVMFIGVMGLKIAAYLQPFTHKLITKVKERRNVKQSEGL